MLVGFVAVMFSAMGSSFPRGSDGDSDGAPSTLAISSSGIEGLTAEAVPAAYRSLFLSAQQNYCPELPLAVFAAQIWQESRWRPDAGSSAGAQGIAQFIPETFAAEGVDVDGGGPSVWSVADSLASSASYNCNLRESVAGIPGDLTSNMLAAYNAGPGTVARYQGVPPITFSGGETYNYVRIILAKAEEYTLAPGAVEAAPSPGSAGQAVLPVSGARLSSTYGPRWNGFHYGIDFAAPMLTPEYAALDGEVVRAGSATGFGLAVYIEHANGDVTVYGHMERILVEVGQRVKAGDPIALLGMRGQSTGPHLHFEVHQGGMNGPRIDPIPWLRDRGVNIGGS